MDNNTVDFLSLSLDIIKIMLVAVAFFYAVYRFNRERFRASSHENLKALISVFDSLHQNPERLKCYGISASELRKQDIDPDQFIHLLKDVIAGQLYYDTNYESDSGMFPKGCYRYNLCSLDSTKRAWPFLKFFISGSKYASLYENTIRMLHPTSDNNAR